MTLSFRDMQDADLENVLFNPDVFGETLYYVPKNGTQRTIYGDAVREAAFEPGMADMDSVAVLDVEVRRHATEGINNPQQGDLIAWDVEGSGDDAVWYTYRRTVSDDGISLRLQFVRDIPSKHGGLPSR